MDPVCHTLVGATLARSGLPARPRLATATLLVGANLPDIDVASYGWGSLAALTFRRGWTHGLLALVVLPAVLALVMMLIDRATSRRRAGPDPEPSIGPYLLLAYVAVLTHPVLDALNTYGMRWLMPFDGRWFYLDVLFIVDPWMWAVLVAGIVLARRAGSARPARLALVAAATYISLMAALTVMAGRAAREAFRRGRVDPVRVLVSPVPVNPFHRVLVIDDGASYHFGSYRWAGRAHVTVDDFAIAQGRDDPAVTTAARTPEGAAFLGWARMPFFQVAPSAAGVTVHMVDARYAVDPDAVFGALSVPLPQARGR